MPQPVRHPKTGVYYYRKVVPQRLRDALGRTEFRTSLGTKDCREAKRRYPEKAAEVDAIIAQASGGHVTLTHKQVTALAGRWYSKKLEEYDDNPGDPLGWEMWADELSDAWREDRIPDFVRAEVDTLLRAEGLVVDERSRKALDETLLSNAIDLTDTLVKRAGGNYRPDPLVAQFPEWQAPGRARQRAEATPIPELFDAWAAEKRFAEKTRYSWDRIIRKITAHLGHEDAAKITDTDIISWKDALVASDLSPKTVENHLIVIKSFFRWAAKNKRIPNNPAADVEYRAKIDPAKARQSYTDDDAKRILAAARLEREAHKRWVPWLAAFTGARCDELCGAMAADVRVEDGIHVIRIDPADREKGGSVKNLASIRSVPLHPALIAEGFLTYVESLPQGAPLFPKLTPDRFGKRGGNGSKTIGRWVRDKVGITDPRKAPNHSWRHRFADQCKKVGIPRELRFALEGHASSDVGDAYGSEGYPMCVLAEVIRKLPNPLEQT
jgi:integrase